MFSILAILTRNELLGFFRSKSALFWALAFPILLLTVMLMAAVFMTTWYRTMSSTSV